MKLMVRERVTHHLDLGETEDSKTKEKYVHCTYECGTRVSGLNEANAPHPDTHLSVSLQEDIIWTSDKPFSIDLKPHAAAKKLFFRNRFPWNSVYSPVDQMHRVHSGALDPDALLTGDLEKGKSIELKFTATQLDKTNGRAKAGVKNLDPHVIVDP